MGDIFTKKKRSEVMSKIKGKGNKSTELRLIALLRSNHIIGWRRHYPVAGKPDFAFPKRKIAIFVDGCFWHVCPKHGRLPSGNKSYWAKKLKRNIQRDKKNSLELRRSGWLVLRVWEHELIAKPGSIAKKIFKAGLK